MPRRTVLSRPRVGARVLFASALAILLTLGAVPAQADDATGTVTGTVTGGGEALADISVVLRTADYSLTRWATTDASGGYLLETVPDGSYTVVVSDAAHDWITRTLTGVVVAGGSATSLDIELTANPRYVVRGAVAGPDGPIEGAEVNGTDGSGSSFQAFTDASGRYEIDTIAAGPINIYAGWNLSSTWQGQSRYGVAVGAAPTEVNFTLVPVPTGDATVRGAVVDRATSQPIEGAFVQLSSMAGFSVNATTDAAGLYEFGSVPSGVHTLSSSRTEFSPGVIEYESQSVSLSVPDGATVVRDLRLRAVPTGTSTIEGRVLDADTGDAVEGAYVFVQRAGSMNGGASIATDAAGGYRKTGLAAGTYAVTVSSNPFGGSTFGSVPTGRVSILADGDTVTHDVEVTLFDTGTGSVTGTVIDSTTSAPVEGVAVSISGRGPRLPYGQVSTDVSGGWSLGGLPDGTYDLYLSTPDPRFERASASTLVISGGAAVVRTDHLRSIVAGAGSITGRVTDQRTHLDIPGATISLVREQGGWNPDPVVSDASGAFRVDALPSGRYYVSISADGYGDSYRTIEVDGDTVATTVVLAPSPVGASGPGVIAGALTDSFGDPVQGVHISAVVGDRIVRDAWSDVDGLYELGALPFGSYDVVTDPAWTAGLSFASTHTAGVSIDAVAPQRTLDLTLPDGAKIIGSVSFSAGAVTGGFLDATVIDPVSGRVVGAGFVQDGVLVVDGLPSGTFVLMVASYTAEEEDPVLTTPAPRYWVDGDIDGAIDLADATRFTVAAGEVREGFDLRLGEGGAITGVVRVATADGSAPLPGGRQLVITASRWDGAAWIPLPHATRGTDAGAAGAFALGGLEEGQYRLRFEDVVEGNRSLTTRTVDATVELGEITELAPVLMTIATPGSAPAAVDLGTLPPETLGALEGRIGVDESATAGDELTVQIGKQFAGEWVSLTANSTPTLLGGWVQVSASGTATVTLPRGLSGAHRIVAQDADAYPIGWSSIEVAAAEGGTDGGGAGGSGGSTPGTSTPGTSTKAGSAKKPTASGAAAPAQPTPTETEPGEVDGPNQADDADGASDDELEGDSGDDDPVAAPISDGGGSDGAPNGWLIGGIVAALLALIAVGGFVLLRRRA